MDDSVIELLEHKFKVEYCSPKLWSGNGLGRCSLADQLIQINSDAGKEVQESTFYHELVHMIADISDLELSESEISALGLGFYSYIKHTDCLVGR